MDATGLSLNWPTVVLILGGLVLITFRPQLRSLLERTKKLSASGWEGQEPAQVPAPQPSTRPTHEVFKAFENQLLLKQEESILADMEKQKLDSPADRERALVRVLAGTQIGLHFERAFRSIFASQLALLVHLNAQPDGDTIDSLRSFYERAVAAYGPEYRQHPYEAYIGYLESYGLVETVGDRLKITLAGTEFLKYIVETKKQLPQWG